MNEEPDNTALLALLDFNSKDRNQENASKVIHELLNGKSSLFIPTLNTEITHKNEWVVAGKDSEFKWPIYKQNGLDTLPVFTTPDLMATWSKGEIRRYTEMFSSEFLKLIEEGKAGHIERILINPGSLNVFWLDRSIK